ncbi:uncharacterized protein M437DRAFT_70760 [Aureobasidium melanogenum CBS 110374]|uniref:Uncharacterized protein n=1 Tax=Aureobasidium melanogenum (strain CBS 110374) TaxID=1043003 RepID=A0A074W4H9_AURM1|nr:uncharacterized protein M437DRAFT_70760 [Aureobasidium melanogenum CBS 110374]KEQ57491.1 hypothetical protein M437DRAFT_70760 [Aureobasidium melanogenum CBS 110374]
MQTCRKPDAALRVPNRQKCPLAFGDFKVAELRCQVLTRYPTGPGASHRLLVSSAPQKANELPTWLFRNRFSGFYNSTPLMHPSKTVLIPTGRLTRRTLHFKQRIENAKSYVRRYTQVEHFPNVSIMNRFYNSLELRSKSDSLISFYNGFSNLIVSLLDQVRSL